MSDTSILDALAEHPFTCGLSPAHRDTLAECTRILGFSAGAMLTEDHKPANDFYLIQSGHVAIEVHAVHRGHITLQTLGAGDVVGWSWLIPPHIWQFDAQVVDPVRVLSLDATRLRGLCERNHELGYEVLKRLVSTISARLSATRLQLLDMHR